MNMYVCIWKTKLSSGKEASENLAIPGENLSLSRKYDIGAGNFRLISRYYGSTSSYYKRSSNVLVRAQQQRAGTRAATTCWYERSSNVLVPPIVYGIVS